MLISDERLMNFCRALNDTVRSGLSLSEAFGILSKSREYSKFLAGAAKMTAAGSQLHEAFAAQKVFPPVFIALLRAGETGGKTEEFLALYADCLEIRIDFRRRIRRAMVYPAFAVLLGAALLTFVMIKAIPTLLGSFFTSGVPVPKQIQWMSALPDYLSEHWPPIVLVLCAAALAARTFMRSRPGRRLTSLAGHWLPVFRFATMEARLYNIYTITGLLLKSGLAPGAMMDVMLKFADDDPVIHGRFLRAASMLAAGNSFAESLSHGLPPEDLRSLEVAERAGRLDETLLRLGKVHFDRHLHRLKLLVSWFKITAAVSIACLAFLIVVAMLGPVITIMLGGTKGLATMPAIGSVPGQAQSPIPANGPQLTNKYPIKDPAALFNQVYGKKVSDLLGNSAAGNNADAATGAKQPPKLRTGQTRLGQGFQLKPRQFQKPVPAAGQTTDTK